MATIVNTPGNTNTDSSATNTALILLFFVVVLFLLAYFGLPLLRRATSVPQVNIPDQVDVNVNTPQQ